MTNISNEDIIIPVEDEISENTKEETNDTVETVVEKSEDTDVENKIKYIDKTNYKTLILDLLIGIFLAFISYAPTVSDITVNIKHIGFNIGLGVVSIFYLFLSTDCIMRLLLSFKIKIKSLNYATILTTISTILVLISSILMWISSFSII